VGATIGNSWIDATVQGPVMIDYSWWHGLIDQPTCDALHAMWKHCMMIDPDDQDPAMAHLNLPPPFHPFNMQDDCSIMWDILQVAGNPNVYDVTTWKLNVDQITFTSKVLPKVKEALHVMNKDHGVAWLSSRIWTLLIGMAQTMTTLHESRSSHFHCPVY